MPFMSVNEDVIFIAVWDIFTRIFPQYIYYCAKEHCEALVSKNATLYYSMKIWHENHQRRIVSSPRLVKVRPSLDSTRLRRFSKLSKCLDSGVWLLVPLLLLLLLPLAAPNTRSFLHRNNIQHTWATPVPHPSNRCLAQHSQSESTGFRAPQS